MDVSVDALLHDLDQIAHLRKNVDKSSYSVCTNKSIPLDDRWELFETLTEQNMLCNQSFGDGFVHLFGKGYSIDSTFHANRFACNRYVDILEYVKQHLNYGRASYPTDEAIIAWKEQVLSNGYSSFTYD